MLEAKPAALPVVSWEQEAEVYQVDFWTQLTDPEPPDGAMWRSEPYHVTGARDVTQVLAWANEMANGRQVAVYVEVERGLKGLVHLFGTDPTRSS